MKKGDKLKPGTPAWNKRQAIWRHNSFFGGIRMAELNMLAIGGSNTTTDEAKNQAHRIYNDLFVLRKLLQKRNPI